MASSAFSSLFSDDIWNSFQEFDEFNDNLSTKSKSTTSFDSDQCVDCKTYTLVCQDGQYLCTNCGTIQQKVLCEEAEYRNYSNDGHQRGSNQERVGAPTNSMMPESSLGTMISNRNYRREGRQYVKKMIQYNSWHQMPYKERSLYKIFTRITNICKTASIPSIIIERAKEFYNTIRDVNTCRGTNRDSLIASCVYFACIAEDVPRSSKEIAEIFQIELHDMTKGIKNFRSILQQATNRRQDTIRKELSNPIDFIERYCSDLHTDDFVKHIAEFVAIKAIFKNYVDDNTTPSIAAGAIYVACYVTMQNVSKKQVADACKTSEVTISKCFKKLNNVLPEILPKEIYAMYLSQKERLEVDSRG
jgi:transcription initiation factor TFIIB